MPKRVHFAMVAAPMDYGALASGEVIACKYVIEREIGRGGMGTVYVAAHATTGKRMALKVLMPELVYRADQVGRFMREAQIMGRVQHRHVVDVYDVGRDGNVLYIVMELLQGKSLTELLRDETLTLEEALIVLVRAMEGVSAAHELGIVHRDLKPDNLFVCEGPTGRLDDPRVLDFGISKFENAENNTLTRSGVAIGTPYYMSIEQLSGHRDLDARVDVYAMGVILYEAIAGEPPYLAESASALAVKVLTDTPVHLKQLRADLPRGLADVVMKAMARKREDRFQTMRALIEALRPFIPQAAGVLVPEGTGRPLRTPRAHTASTMMLSGERQTASLSTPPPPYLKLSDSAVAQPSTNWVRLALIIVCVLGVIAMVVIGSELLSTPKPQLVATPPLPTLTAQPTPKLDPVEVDAGALFEITKPAPEPTPVVVETPKADKHRPKKQVEPPPPAVEPPPVVVHPPVVHTPPPPKPVAPSAAEEAAKKTAKGRAGQIGSDEF